MGWGTVDGSFDDSAHRMANRESFEAFWEAMFPRAFRLAYRVLENVPLAEDVAAEALARACVSWRNVQQLGYRDAWVLRVAANLAVDAARRRTPIGVRPPPTNMEDAVTDRVVLAQALRALSRRQREAITLRYLADLREEEVAAVLGISTGAVKRHAHRGVAALRSRLGDSFEEVTTGGD